MCFPSLHLFNANLSPQRYWQGPVLSGRGGGGATGIIPGGGEGRTHHHDGLILLMMGSDESRFKVLMMGSDESRFKVLMMGSDESRFKVLMMGSDESRFKVLMMGSDESRFKVPFNARRRATRRSTQSATCEEKGEPSRAMERRRPLTGLITARPNRPTRTWATERRRPLTSRIANHRQARPAH